MDKSAKNSIHTVIPEESIGKLMIAIAFTELAFNSDFSNNKSIDKIELFNVACEWYNIENESIKVIGRELIKNSSNGIEMAYNILLVNENVLGLDKFRGIYTSYVDLVNDIAKDIIDMHGLTGGLGDMEFCTFIEEHKLDKKRAEFSGAPWFVGTGSIVSIGNHKYIMEAKVIDKYNAFMILSNGILVRY